MKVTRIIGDITVIFEGTVEEWLAFDGREEKHKVEHQPWMDDFKEGEHDPSLTYKENGAYYGSGEVDLDLINIPKKHVRWLNVYAWAVTTNSSKDQADNVACKDRIACIRIEYEEGEGL